jgi:hypothetical protein
MRDLIVPKEIKLVNPIRGFSHVTYGWSFMMMLATITILSGLLRETTTEKHIEEFLSCEFRLKATSVRILVCSITAVIEVVSSTNVRPFLFGSIKIVRLSLLSIGKNCDSITNCLECLSRS